MMRENSNIVLPSPVNPYLPKFKQIKQVISDMIHREELKEGQLVPSEKELAVQFSVDKSTVIKALNELKMEGLVNRVQGKGTFVNKLVDKLTSKEIVGLIMPATGHLYGALATGIMKGLAEHRHFCLVVDPSSMRDDRQSYEKIKALIEKSPGALVIEGTSRFPFELLENYHGRVIFVDVYEAEAEYPSTRILSDYYEGGRLVVDHFICAGFSKIFYYAHRIKPNHKTRLNTLAGARQALRDHNLPEDNFTLYPDDITDTELDETLKNIEKPLAIFCHGDSRANRIYAAARRLGLQIPKDISIIGYYNTPWCEVFDPHLSSVSIREQDIAEHVVEAILTGSNRDILLKPELILRGSSLNA